MPKHKNANIVYILTNKAMPNYVKIGTTSNLAQRMGQLDNTSIPLPFTCFYACKVEDGAFVERQLHAAFSDRRVRDKREFFEISPEQAAAALVLASKEDITPGATTTAAAAPSATRRPNFDFRMVDIPQGAMLTYLHDENIKAKVITHRKITCEAVNGGHPTSLSSAAQALAEYPYQVQGTIYWLYEEETLDARRQRLEGTSDEEDKGTHS